jgi:hypothetical protein
MALEAVLHTFVSQSMSSPSFVKWTESFSMIAQASLEPIRSWKVDLLRQMSSELGHVVSVLPARTELIVVSPMVKAKRGPGIRAPERPMTKEVVKIRIIVASGTN